VAIEIKDGNGSLELHFFGKVDFIASCIYITVDGVFTYIAAHSHLFQAGINGQILPQLFCQQLLCVRNDFATRMTLFDDGVAFWATMLAGAHFS